MRLMKAESHPFIQMLHRELLERTKRNPRYSLRAFAKALDMNHAHLSLVMRGERSITQKLISRVAMKLGLDFSKLPQIMNPATNHRKSTLPTWIPMHSDQFESISEWYHDAILELVRFSDFQQDEAWVAQELGISHIQAKDALSRLARLGLIQSSPDKPSWIQSLDTTTNTDTLVTSPALRRLQMALLEKSKYALENQSREIRDHTSLTVAINKRNFKKAKQMIAAFRSELMHALQDEELQYNEVYQLTVSFFPLTSGKRITKKSVSRRQENKQTHKKEKDL